MTSSKVEQQMHPDPNEQGTRQIEEEGRQESSGKRKRSWTSHDQPEEHHDSNIQSLHSTVCAPVRLETLGLSGIQGLEPRRVLHVLSGFGQWTDQHLHCPAMAELIVEIMSRGENDAQLRLYCIRLLSATGGCNRIHPFKVAVALVDVMKAHPTCQSLLLESMQALRRWAGNNVNNLHILAKSGAIPFLLDSLVNHCDSLIIQYVALDLLRSLASHSAEERALMSSHIPSILGTLSSALYDTCMQQIGLSLLSWLAENPEIRDIIVYEGGVSFLLQALQICANDRLIQCNATATLCWLMHATKEYTSQKATETIDSREAFQIVIQTMRRSKDIPSVFGNCACILGGLLAPSDDRVEQADILDANGTLELTIDGMKQHRYFPKVQRNCLNLLRLFSWTLIENQLELGQNHGLVVILDAMKTHAADAGIQSEACCLLANLGSTNMIDAILSTDCIETVTNCLFKHKDEVRVQQAAVWFHNCVLQNERSRSTEAVDAFGGGEPVINAMLIGLRRDQL